MYAFVRGLKWQQGMLVEGSAFLTSLVIAEFFYKWHSFTLECLGFLTTWFVVSGVFAAATRMLRAQTKEAV